MHGDINQEIAIVKYSATPLKLLKCCVIKSAKCNKNAVQRDCWGKHVF